MFALLVSFLFQSCMSQQKSIILGLFNISCTNDMLSSHHHVLSSSSANHHSLEPLLSNSSSSSSSSLCSPNPFYLQSSSAGGSPTCNALLYSTRNTSLGTHLAPPSDANLQQHMLCPDSYGLLPTWAVSKYNL